MQYALITCLDSEPAPASLLGSIPALNAAGELVRRIGGGLMVPTELLRDRDVPSELFFGFDEIFFFPTDEVPPKPGAVSIVGPGRIDQEKLDKLGRWLVDNDCSLALGDGAGLNIITKARGLFSYLLAQSMSQPEPAFELNGYLREDKPEAMLSEIKP